MSLPSPRDLARFIRNLEEDKLLLPALWMVRRSSLGAILKGFTPNEQDIEIIEDRLRIQDHSLYEYVQERLKENGELKRPYY